MMKWIWVSGLNGAVGDVDWVTIPDSVVPVGGGDVHVVNNMY